MKFAEINEIALSNAKNLVESWIPGGKFRGSEYVVKNPKRADDTAGSFSINTETGLWNDFAHPIQENHGDLIDLFAWINDLDVKTAANQVAELCGNIVPDIKPAKKQPKWESAGPAPRELTEFESTTWVGKENSKVKASKVWYYRNRDGDPIGAVARFEKPEGGKDIRPYQWMREPGKRPKWKQAGFPKPRPFYNFHLIYQKPNAYIVVVEGEKCADALQMLMNPDQVVVTCWPNGSKSIVHMDFNQVNGRKLFLWPDNDPAGFECMKQLSLMVTPDTEIKIVQIPDEFPHKYDVADLVADSDDPKTACIDVLKTAIPYVPEQEPEIEPPEYTDVVPYEHEPVEVKPQSGNYLDQFKLERDEWFETTSKGRPLNTIENCIRLLDHYGISARYNIVSKSVEILIPGKSFSIDNQANVTLAHLRSLSQRNNYPVTDLESYIKAIAENNIYNPIALWIQSKPWDGVDRIPEFLNTIKSPNEPLKNLLIKRWMIQAIAALFKPPPFAAHGMLVFQGAQGIGKTTWAARLLPDMLSSQYIGTGQILDPGSKDSIVSAITKWIVELGELGSTLRKDVDRIKAFATNSFDRVRRPYDRMESEYPRKTVFFASVNEKHFLKDDTGNRRFWVVDTSEIDYLHKIDMQQVWAQCLMMYNDGERCWLDNAEKTMLDESNEDYMEHNPMEDMILNSYQWESDRMTWRRMTATSILLELGFSNPTRAQSTAVGRVLVALGHNPRKSKGARYYTIPKKVYHESEY